MYILGISAFYHDAAAVLLKDGRPVTAAQEERFTRIKHDASFPINAIRFCLEFEGISINKVELVAFYEKPFQKFDRIIDVFSRTSPRGFFSFRKAMKSWLSEKLWIPNIIQKKLDYKGKIIFVPHHESHAASAFFSSPFSNATIVVMDAVGEKSSTSISLGQENKISLLEEQLYPHSLGLFYSAFTYYCGFKVNSGEYKLMGLAPYGKPTYLDFLKEHFIQVDDDGAVTLQLENYDFEVGLKMLSKKGIQVLGKPINSKEIDVDTYYKDIAATVQAITEEVVLKTIQYAISRTDTKNVVLAGGVALNCKANGELLSSIDGIKLWVQPAAGDAGGALGAAQIGWFHFQNNNRIVLPDSPKNNVFLGPSFDSKTVKEILDSFNIQYTELSEENLCTLTAKLLEEKNIVGWFQGRMEFGPRALGNRSILASPLYEDMKSHLNLSIKKREGFRPFAPAVKEDKSQEWFIGCTSSKYMLATYRSLRKVEIPSCIHEDATARVQTVTEQDNPKFYQLLDAFETISGCPILINTSFNVRGEPIVCSVEDALRCFVQTEMDALVIETFLITKKENTNPHHKLTTAIAINLD